MKFGLGDTSDPIFMTGTTGAPADPDSFASFLAANPTMATQYTAYQAANPGDPNIQLVGYNPLTGVYGPLPSGWGTTTTPAVIAGTPTYVWVLGAGVIVAFLLAGKRR